MKMAKVFLVLQVSVPIDEGISAPWPHVDGRPWNPNATDAFGITGAELVEADVDSIYLPDSSYCFKPYVEESMIICGCGEHTYSDEVTD